VKHFLSTSDWSREELESLLQSAEALKKNPINSSLKGRSIALLFLNPSMRTRTSFDLGMQQMGGIAIVLQPGKDAWGLEFDTGAIMEGEAEEHIAEAAGVLSRYCDLIGLRAFPSFVDWSKDREDNVIKSLARYSSVPVINMDWHPRPLNTAVANSALLMGTKFGMDVTLLCPEPDYILDSQFMDQAKANATASGGSLQVSHDIESAYTGADFVYAKSWGALPYYGRPTDEYELRKNYRHFIVSEEKMALTNNGLFSHCLPLRRNVKATDGVMDAPYCLAMDEAENRLHVQKALMMNLLGADQ